MQDNSYLDIQYTNIEVGVVASLDQRDECLITLAQAKRAIAKAERRLAHCRTKETKVLHRLQVISKELADRRLAQADINIERAKFYHKRSSEIPRLAGTPYDILTTLSKPSFSILENLMLQ